MSSSDPISNFLTTKPSSQTIVYQGRRTLYQYPDDEAVYVATHTYLDHVENVLISHWYNDASTEQQYEKSYTTERKVTTGQEFSSSVTLGASFEGLSVGTTEETKTFSTTETTSSDTKKVTVTVAAYSDMYFYQRKYVFRTEMTWVLDAWGGLWNVGSQGGYHIQKGECLTEIHAEEYVTSEKPLESTNSLAFVTLTYVDERAGTTRQWGNTTPTCQSALEAIGINGSQQ